MPDPGLTVDDLTLPVQAVRNLRCDLDAMSIAEVLWLAASSGGGAADVDAAKPTAAETAAERRPGGPPARRGAVIRRPERPVSALSTGSLVAGRRVQVARARPFPQQLLITRSLRPFKRRWPRGRRMRLDIGATVAAYARTWQLVPVYASAPERWFEVALVVDDSPSMEVWDEEVAGMSAVLRQAGTFTTVRDFRISVPGTGEAPSLFNEAGRQYRADQLRAPDARRVILVVTDGATPGWHRPAVWQVLRAWAATTPTVLVSPLPIRLWWRTGLDLPAVRISSVAPGGSNAMLKYSVPLALWEEGHPERVWRPVPAVTLNPRRLARWARMLMRGDPIGSEALLIPPEGRLPGAEPVYDPPPDRDIAAAFLRVAAPAAARLAVLCSPFPTLSLPLLRLIRQRLVPDAATGDIAEVVISRLFQPQDPAVGGDGEILRFRDGARQVLQESLTESDAWRVYDALRARIDQRGSAGSFDAAVLNPSGDVALPAGLLPSFAETERGVLDVLGFLDVLPDTVPIIADPASGAADAASDEQAAGSGQE